MKTLWLVIVAMTWCAPAMAADYFGVVTSGNKQGKSYNLSITPADETCGGGSEFGSGCGYAEISFSDGTDFILNGNLPTDDDTIGYYDYWGDGPYSYIGPTYYYIADPRFHDCVYCGTISEGALDAGAAIPEPVTWLILLSGFGTLGSMLRVARRPHFRRLGRLLPSRP
ncbi:MAG TPA: hypothetical protein VGV14_10870 [Rhodanobacter sp.]|nr:hypothetical protein [Rhodanobacter sp.]